MGIAFRTEQSVRIIVDGRISGVSARRGSTIVEKGKRGFLNARNKHTFKCVKLNVYKQKLIKEKHCLHTSHAG